MGVPPFAFFDVDDTLIRTKSMFSFFEFWCKEWVYDRSLLERFQNHFKEARAQGVPREQMNRDYYHYFAGCEPRVLAEAGDEWARTVIEQDLFHEGPVRRLKEMAKTGTVAVFVSGSFLEVLEPLAMHLNVKDVLCTQMKIGADGVFTGEIGDPQTIGAGKATAIEEFLKNHRVSPEECWAFGDDISDLPMLEYVGSAVAVGTNAELGITARARGWSIIEAT